MPTGIRAFVYYLCLCCVLPGGEFIAAAGGIVCGPVDPEALLYVRYIHARGLCVLPKNADK